jgi:hypothetical protein
MLQRFQAVLGICILHHNFGQIIMVEKKVLLPEKGRSSCEPEGGISTPLKLNSLFTLILFQI